MTPGPRPGHVTQASPPRQQQSTAEQQLNQAESAQPTTPEGTKEPPRDQPSPQPPTQDDQLQDQKPQEAQPAPPPSDKPEEPPPPPPSTHVTQRFDHLHHQLTSMGVDPSWFISKCAWHGIDPREAWERAKVYGMPALNYLKELFENSQTTGMAPPGTGSRGSQTPLGGPAPSAIG